MNKKAVQFRKRRNTAHDYERLIYCTSCGSYSILPEERCISCGSNEKSLLTLIEYGRLLAARAARTEFFIAIAWVMIAVSVAGTLREVAVAVLGGAIFLTFLHLLNSRYRPQTDLHILEKLLVQDTSAIQQGLLLDLKQAKADMEANRVKETYEKLREISTLLLHESIKFNKILCLNQFYIRKDMELELETVVPRQFNPHFIHYLLEAVQVNKQLVRQNVLDYVVAHRVQIEQMEIGRDVMVLVMSASLRMKSYVYKYRHTLINYIDELPKERFHRLCRMIGRDPAFIGTVLHDRCLEIAKRLYGSDPDFYHIF